MGQKESYKDPKYLCGVLMCTPDIPGAPWRMRSVADSEARPGPGSDQGKAASSSRLLASDWSRTLHAGLWLAEVPVTVSGGSGGWMSRAEAAAGASLVPPSAKCQPQSQARHHRPQQVCHHHHQGGHRYHYQWSKCYYHVSSGGVNHHEKPNIWTRHR